LICRWIEHSPIAWNTQRMEVGARTVRAWSECLRMQLTCHVTSQRALFLSWTLTTTYHRWQAQARRPRGKQITAPIQQFNFRIIIHQRALSDQQTTPIAFAHAKDKKMIPGNKKRSNTCGSVESTLVECIQAPTNVSMLSVPPNR
jgi:hypothetical protein